MRRRSSSDRTRLRRSRPSITLSLASSRSCMSTAALLRRAASKAASFTTFASSAPARPGVPGAMRSRSTLEPSGILRVCTRRICSRPFTSGISTTIWRSKRPGRSRAGSRMSGRFVAASRMTPSFDSKPSISTSSWLSVCSRSSCPPPRPAPRCRPTASISSMKMMHGAWALPCPNRSRTRAAPTLEVLQVLEEVDDLFELLLRLVRARHVGKGHLRGVARQELGLRLPEREGAIPPLLHLAQHENQQAEDQQVREEAEQEHADRLLLLARPDIDALLADSADPGVARFEGQQRGEMLCGARTAGDGTLEVPLHLLPLGDLDRGDVALIELLGEFAVGDLHRLRASIRGELHEHHGPDDQERPERERPQGPGPAELARRWNAVGHQVRLATYGR